MQQINDILALRSQLEVWRCAGDSIALVPTMGCLHRGHFKLIEQAKSLAQRVIVSIFVNPMQFSKDEDFATYPRILSVDLCALRKQQVSLVFVPDTKILFPTDMSRHARVHIPALEDVLCGRSRPGHFCGVMTIVTKLFNIIQPNIAIFGEKDFQQLVLIRQLVDDLVFPIRIVGCPTVREADGLAMSSRNAYLSKKERTIAPILYQTLISLAEQIESGERDYLGLVASSKMRLSKTGFKPDYVTICDRHDLGPPKDNDLQVLIAAWLGKARLIDNIAARI